MMTYFWDGLARLALLPDSLPIGHNWRAKAILDFGLPIQSGGHSALRKLSLERT